MPVTRSLDVFFDLRMNKRLSKPSRRQWFETPSRSSWHHCNDIIFCWVCNDSYKQAYCVNMISLVISINGVLRRGCSFSTRFQSVGVARIVYVRRSCTVWAKLICMSLSIYLSQTLMPCLHRWNTNYFFPRPGLNVFNVVTSGTSLPTYHPTSLLIHYHLNKIFGILQTFSNTFCWWK